MDKYSKKDKNMKFKMLVEKLNPDQFARLMADVQRQMDDAQDPNKRQRIKRPEERIADTLKLFREREKEAQKAIEEFRNRPGVKSKCWGYQKRNVIYYVGTTDFAASATYDSQYDTSYGHNGMYSVDVTEDGEKLFSNTFDEDYAMKFIRKVAEARDKKGSPLTAKEIEKMYRG